MANEVQPQSELGKVVEARREAYMSRVRRSRPLVLLIALAIATAGLLLHRDWLFVVGFVVFLVAFITGGGV